MLDFTVSVFDEVEADKSVDRRSLVWLSRGRCEKFGVLGEGLIETTRGLKENFQFFESKIRSDLLFFASSRTNCNFEVLI